MGNLLHSPYSYEILVAINAYLEYQEKQYYGRHRAEERGRNRHRDRGYAIAEVNRLSEGDFRKMFRINKAGFEDLLSTLEPFMFEGNLDMATRSSGSSISIRTKLMCTLRWLAGGSYLDITFAFGVSKSAFFSSDNVSGVVWPTINAINEAFTIGLPIHNADKLKSMAEDFAEYSNGHMKGCVTAIDGWVARTRKPFQVEVKDVMSYRNRHDCWGLVVMAGCDAKCRYTVFSCKSSGSTNDVVAWDISNAKDIVEGSDWPSEYYVVGDEAFVCTNNFLTPYSGRSIGPWKDSFNYHLSSMRQCIERSFALLVQRWGLLWRPLRCEFKRWSKVLSACAKLHNFCIDNCVPTVRERSSEDLEDSDEDVVILNQSQQSDEDGNWVQQSLRTGRRRRNAFKCLFEINGVRRPHFAIVNSRA